MRQVAEERGGGGDLLLGREFALAHLLQPRLGDLDRLLEVVEHLEAVAGPGHLVEADDLDSIAGTGQGHLVAAPVGHAAHAAVPDARKHHVADREAAALDEEGGGDALALVAVGLEDGAGCGGEMVGLQLEDLGLEGEALE